MIVRRRCSGQIATGAVVTATASNRGAGTMRPHPRAASVCQGGCIGVLALLESEGDGDVCLVLVRTKPCFDLFSEGALCFVCGRFTIERNSPGALATLSLA